MDFTFVLIIIVIALLCIKLFLSYIKRIVAFRRRKRLTQNKDAIGAPGALSEFQLQQKWQENVNSGRYWSATDHPVCDICSKPVGLGECYNLTTEQVTTREAYWNYVFTHLNVHSWNSQGGSVGDLARKMSEQSTAWGICESCSHMFNFDREAARGYAQHGLQHIPGGGPADLDLVLLAAAEAWKNLYGSYPTSIRVE